MNDYIYDILKYGLSLSAATVGWEVAAAIYYRHRASKQERDRDECRRSAGNSVNERTQPPTSTQQYLLKRAQHH